MLGQSPAFQLLTSRIDKYAACDACVLIEGETGTGKEVAARAIHYRSRRRNAPFVPVNCGAIPESLVESELFGHKRGAFTDARSDELGFVAVANGGTLFLDEVDSLSAKAQVALLRFLQDYRYSPVGNRSSLHADVRVLAATNADLRSLIRAQRFRSDLYYRLRVLPLHVPPLRERGSDVLELADHFLSEATSSSGRRRTLDLASRELLLDYGWPGNIRELESVVRRAALLDEGSDVSLTRKDLGLEGDLLEVQETALPEGWNFREARRQVLASFERQFLCRLLTETGGNVSRAATLSGKERRALGKLLKKHGIDRCGFR
jgi:transcriptional regulator with GAF, ATPase, and Fis domain